MEVKITFTNMEHTPSLDERIRKKSKKLEKYLEGSAEEGAILKWTCNVKPNQHDVELVLHGPKFTFSSSASAEDLYHTFDLVIDKMEKQLQKKKDKWKNHIHHKHEEKVEFYASKEEGFEDIDTEKED
ncbi:MAG: ribosome-associated translation inhibitor RaiA [Epsilonproteobacteria bacterium]|nr:MAG: ribosome-associated translation inhibitor RaiA [Campylobacterota bacterium]